MPEMAKSGGQPTPMMQQWLSLKEQAGDSLLFFRLGDFFELFNEDAEVAAPVMGVTLTSRGGKSAEDKQPLCGVPIHNFEIYLHKLLDAGFSIALAEQTEEAGPQIKLVKREIVQWFSPGIRFLHQDERPSYCAVVTGKARAWHFAAADVATGHLVLESGETEENLQALLQALPVLDLRIPYREKFSVDVKFQRACYLMSERDSQKLIMDSLHLTDWEDCPSKNLLSTQALGTLLQILKEAHPRHRLHFQRPNEYPNSVWMNSSTRRNLNLDQSSSVNLFDFLNQTKTAMGRRRLKEQLMHPSTSAAEIQDRQNLVQFFKSNSRLRSDFRNELQQVLDLHRLLRKKTSASNLYSLSQSLGHSLSAAERLEKNSLSLGLDLQPLQYIYKTLSKHLQWSEEADLGWVKAGINSQLDELRDLESNASSLLSQLEDTLRAQTGVNTLKIKFHQVFGYVADFGSIHQTKIPPQAKTVQTLANSVRFKTKELNQLEEKLLSLGSRIKEAESAEIAKLAELVEQHQNFILQFCDQISYFDFVQSLAEVSSKNRWVTPKSATEEQKIQVKKATHPLSQENFVPLTFELSQSSQRCILLSGPNMAGKSTVLRIAALMALLHQIGSDVPAENCELSIFDRIMCRMGAFDDLAQGKSTFFVEMKEVSNMLSGASQRSLLLFDELGRGTSTFDGMSLAWAITEAVHDLGALSMVATHYLEMAKLEKFLPALKNYHLGVKQIDDQLVFTRKLERGPASQSYGIQVARLADIPERILERASQKLSEFESKRKKPTPLFETNLFYEEQSPR